MNQEIVYSKERGTYNLIVDGEWYIEGTYEQCSDAMFNNAYYSDDYDYEDVQ